MTGNTFYFHWEVTLMIWLQAHLGTAGAKIAEVITCLGEEVVYILIFGILYFCLNKKAAKDIGKGLVIALVANPMIKVAFSDKDLVFDFANVTKEFGRGGLREFVPAGERTAVIKG